MNVDQFYAVLVYVWAVVQEKAPIMGAVIAFTVASLRMVLEKNYRFAEGLLCAVFAAIACTGGEVLSAIVLSTTGLHIPANIVGGFAAGGIGYAGSKTTVAFIKHKFKLDTKGSTNDPNKG